MLYIGEKQISTEKGGAEVGAHTFHPSNQEAEARGFPWVWGQAGLHSKFQNSRGSVKQKNPISKDKTTNREEGRGKGRKQASKQASKHIGISSRKTDSSNNLVKLNASEYTLLLLKTGLAGAGAMAQQYIQLAAFPEDPG